MNRIENKLNLVYIHRHLNVLPDSLLIKELKMALDFSVNISLCTCCILLINLTIAERFFHRWYMNAIYARALWLN